MLSARAYSFRHQSRLAISLSWIGGYTDVACWLACSVYTSHLTGATTGFGQAMTERDWPRVALLGLVLISFFLGAVASACMTEGARRRGHRSKYLLPIAVTALLLAAFAAGVYRHPHASEADPAAQLWMPALAAFAMGLQNATITRISGSVVRTTHVTGVVTDLGLEGVQLLLWYRDHLRGRRAQRAGRLMRITQRHPSFLRIALLASIWGSFLFGAVAGTLAYLRWPRFSILPPLLFLLWIILLDWRTPISDVRELDLFNDPELAAQGIVKSLLPEGVGIYRFTHPFGRAAHRAPNFQLWVDHLPRHWRLIVLALSPHTRFEANAILDLEQAVLKLRAQGRQLILAGITPTQFRALDALGVARIIDTRNLCPDLEFALARVLAELPTTPVSPTTPRLIAGIAPHL